MKKIIPYLLLILCSGAYAQTQDKNYVELERKIDLLAEEIAALKAYQTMESTNTSFASMGPSASKVYSIPRAGISIGAYGEVVYNHKAKENQDGDAVSNDPTTEAQRFVIYLGYKFSEKWVFNSEIEIEHVNEIYNEFMYVDHLHSKELNYRFGLMLLPIGIVNEQHEPTLFSSVQRPETDKFLVPSTWREIGVGVFGDIGKVSYKAYAINGGDADGIKASSGFRGQRKKGGADSKNNASTGAIILRADYNFDSQSFAGISTYQGQGSSASTESLEVALYDLHAQYTINNLRLRAQFDIVNYTNSEDWNEVATEVLPENIYGGYLEAQYAINKFRPFVRYERINLNGKFDEDVYTYNGSTDFYSYRVGLAFQPLDRLTFKADYAIKNNKDDSGVNEFNLGMGFNF